MDTTATRAFAARPGRPVVATAFWAAAAAVATFALRGTDWLTTIDAAAIVGALAAACGLLAVRYLVKALRRKRTPVVVSPDGVLDERVSSSPIPWGAIDGIAAARSARRAPTTMHLTLDPAFEDGRPYRRSLRLRARLDRAMGRTGVDVTSAGLKASFDELITVATAYKKVALDETPIAERRMVATALPEATLRRQQVAAAERFPHAAFALLAILILVFMAEVAFAPRGESAVSLSAQTLADFGGMSRALVDRGQWWRLFTGPLLHAGPLHILMNGIALVFGGFLLERLLGWRWFLTTFAIGAIAGGVGSYVLNSPAVVTVGASGGILGLFAATMVVAFRHPEAGVRSYLMRGAAQVLIPTLIPFASIKGMHIDVAAHFGGAVGGLLSGLLIVAVWDARAVAPRGVAMATLGSIAYLATAVVAMAMAARNFDDKTALDPDLPTTFATIVQKAPELIKAHPRDPRIRYALALKDVTSGRIEHGEAALTALASDADAERIWPHIGASAQKALSIVKADVEAGRRPFTRSAAKGR